MNRRGFLSLSLLAPVAGVMAARDAMAAPAIANFGSFAFANGPAGEFIAGEPIHEWPPRLQSINEVRFLEDRIFTTRDIAEMYGVPPAEIRSRSDESAALRDEPGVAS